MLSVTHGETYDRPRRWWICAGVFLFLIVAISLWKADWRGVVLLLLFFGTYIWYDWKLKHEKYSFDLDATWIKIWNEIMPRNTISAYSMIYASNWTTMKTLYLYKAQDVDILTLHWPQDEIQDLAEALADIVPLRTDFALTWVRRLLRFLRI